VNNLSIKRIFESFRQLDHALNIARKSLDRCEEPPQDLLSRISAYEDILEKQRNLATAMCGYASLENWEEVHRHIKLINGLSAMIRDDAREAATVKQHEAGVASDEPAMLC
jgi:hypothetical protein